MYRYFSKSFYDVSPPFALEKRFFKAKNEKVRKHQKKKVFVERKIVKTG